MNKSEKDLKHALIETRKSIQNKFKKLNRERTFQDIKNARKYRPITDSINKLLPKTQKKLVQSSEKNEDKSDSDNTGNDSDDFSTTSDLEWDDFEQHSAGDDDEVEDIETKSTTKRKEQDDDDDIPLKKIKKPILSKKREKARVAYLKGLRRGLHSSKKTKSSRTAFLPPVLTSSHFLSHETEKRTRSDDEDSLDDGIQGKYSKKLKRSTSRKKSEKSEKMKEAVVKLKDIRRTMQATPTSRLLAQESRILDDRQSETSNAQAQSVQSLLPYEITVLPDGRRGDPRYRGKRDNSWMGPDSKITKKLRFVQDQHDSENDDSDDSDDPRVHRQRSIDWIGPNGKILKEIKIEPEDDSYVDTSAIETEKKKEKENEKEVVPLRRSTRVKSMGEKRYGYGIESEFIPYEQNISYEYWDDPNELVDRLRLLVSSKAAGHSGHNKEIMSIVEELRESNIIK